MNTVKPNSKLKIRFALIDGGDHSASRSRFKGDLDVSGGPEGELKGDLEGDFRGDFKQDWEGDLLSSSGQV